MSRTVLPFAVADITALARSLRGQLLEKDATPSHLSLLNMLARAAGFRNFQHFRAEKAPTVAQPARPVPAASERPVPDERGINRLARYFDATGRLVRWPSKYGHRLPCLWALWADLPPRQVFDEAGISQWLNGRHLFGDPALLRRELCDQGLVARTRDGREYRRLEREPSPEGLALIRRLREAKSGRKVAA